MSTPTPNTPSIPTTATGPHAKAGPDGICTSHTLNAGDHVTLYTRRATSRSALAAVVESTDPQHQRYVVVYTPLSDPTPRRQLIHDRDAAAGTAWTTPINTAHDTINPAAPMSALEFACLLDYLGVDRSSYARVLEVNDRTVRRWIDGTSPVPTGVASTTRALATYTHRLTDELAATTTPDQHNPDDADTYWTPAAQHAGIDTWHHAPNRWWPTILGHLFTHARTAPTTPGTEG